MVSLDIASMHSCSGRRRRAAINLEAYKPISTDLADDLVVDERSLREEC